MTGFICACASEECAVLGCRRVREISAKPLQPNLNPNTNPIASPAWLPRAPLTEHDVRRIVREELEKLLKPEPPKVE